MSDYGEFWYRDVFYPRIAVVRSQASAIAKLAPGIIAIISPQNKPKSVKFLCPCGCGEIISINLIRESGRAWRLYFSEKSGISLIPSVWLDSGCESHFILHNNIARMLFGRIPKMTENEEFRWWSDAPERSPVVETGGAPNYL